MKIIKKLNKTVVALNTGEKMVIPSSLYPLETDPYRMFDCSNTEYIENDEIFDIFDSVTLKPGFAYSSIHELVIRLKAAGYEAEQYIGWIFLGEFQPVHHSIAVVGDSILDLRICTNRLIKHPGEESQLSYDEMRFIVAENYKSHMLLPNHEICVTGKCEPEEFYIMAPGSMEQGVARNLSLRKIYPNHPAFKDIGDDKLTQTQRNIYGV